MAHLAARSGYRSLVERLNRAPQGAPPSELLYQILEILFSPREAELVSLLPIKPFGVRTAARAWSVSEAEAREVLDRLASRAILLDLERNGDAAVRAAPAHGGLLRVLDDADPGRRRPEAPGAALLRVPERGGGLHPRAVHPGRHPARPDVRPGTGARPRRSRSGSWTTSGPAPRSARPTISRWGSATAGTRWSTSAGPARPAGRSASPSGTPHARWRSTASPGPSTPPRAWTCCRRPRTRAWPSSGRTCASTRPSSATAAAAAARP